MRLPKILLAILFSFSLHSSFAQPWYKQCYYSMINLTDYAYTYNNTTGGVLATSTGSTLYPWHAYLKKFDAAGDDVWDQQVNIDTFMAALLKAPVVLTNNDILVYGFVVDTAVVNGYTIINRYNAAGTLLTQQFSPTNSTTWSNHYGLQFIAGNNCYYEVSRLDTGYMYYDFTTSINYHVPIYRTYLKKYDITGNLLWNTEHALIDTVESGSYIESTRMGIEPGTAKLFNDGGIVAVKYYDTLSYPLMENAHTHIQRFGPSGNLLWSTDLNAIFNLPANLRLEPWSISVTSDSCVLVDCFASDVDSLFTVGGTRVVKLNAAGTPVAQFETPLHRWLMDGQEMGNGNFIFTTVIPDTINNWDESEGLAIYDANLNFLSYHPAALNPDFRCKGFFTNIYGGAFALGSANNGDHFMAYNFDSLLNYYPAVLPGSLTLDNNQDCQFNTGDLHTVTGAIKLTNGTNNEFFAFSDVNGAYNAGVPLGAYTVTHPVSSNKQVLCLVGNSYSYSLSAPGIYPPADFYSGYIPNQDDITISFYPAIFIPGFNTVINAIITNTGSVLANTTATITLPAGMQFNSAVPSPTTISGNVLTFDIVSLQPDSSLSISIDITLDQSTPLGSTVAVMGEVPLTTDVHLIDNSAVLESVVVGSFDPNDKAVNQPPVCTPDQQFIYKIRFQNTGTYYARNVVLKDTISDLLDMSTFKLLSSSHFLPEVKWSVGNCLTFTYDNINLPDSNMDEPGSHGYFVYSIKPKWTVAVGEYIVNTANIFFDFNLPVVTNTTVNMIGAPSSVRQVTTKDNLVIYPNPVTDILTIRSEDYESFEVINTLGQLMLEGRVQTGETKIYLKNLPSGIYSIKLLGAKGYNTAKIQKL